MARATRWAVLGLLVIAGGACAVLWPRRGAAPPRPSLAASQPTSQPASQPTGTPLTITVKDLRNHKGQLIFGVFKSSEGFPNKEKNSVYWEVKDASADSVTFTTRLPPGRYAASVLHDENRSGEMDRGFGGIPLEGYGVTNNPKPKMRAAKFEEATFDLPERGAELTISVQYSFL